MTHFTSVSFPSWLVEQEFSSVLTTPVILSAALGLPNFDSPSFPPDYSSSYSKHASQSFMKHQVFVPEIEV